MTLTFVERELSSQPATWQMALELEPHVRQLLPRDGERVAVVGCGSSWFMAMSYAALRESSGKGETDAFSGSEFPEARRYDRVVAITRSGVTTEIVDLLKRLNEPKSGTSTPTVVITAVKHCAAADAAGKAIVMEFADEQSVVQTRFATAGLTLLRASLGENLDPVISQGQTALELPIDDLITAEQVTFIGRGAALGLATEAALKCREAAQLWTESYPAMDYRHGPIAIAQPGRLVWSLGESPVGLREEVEATGAQFVNHQLDPQAELVVAQRFAVAVALDRGLDPDRPRALSRAVLLG